ncbi:MAG: hypothetical protein CL693_17070 [Cellvibrionaceae bacterium]|nr:hypothetical protein [Cellvibrionaceae bacterium]|tara:strand:- start:62507 stop:65230 length:2724 start_codon:yes stop_codon:yes gene_type:complete
MIEIPGYSIVRTLGKGGMAEVYLAIQQSFEREVALKVLAPHLTGDDTFSERFLREAKIVSRLVHPNIVTVYDVGIQGDSHFLSMEYIPGEDLKQSRSDLSLVDRINVVKDIARALNFAGKKGYVHRDVKPENIMLHAEDGRAVLMDFGIARPSELNTGMTQTGTAIGTPHYMSPEQARGQDVDPRSDLYSLGVVLFLLLAGHVPYDADSAVAVGIKHVAEPIPLLPSELQIFQSIINKALSKEPAHRFQNGAEFVAALDTISESELREIEQIVERSQLHHRDLEAQVDTDAPTVISEALVAPGDVPASGGVKSAFTGSVNNPVSEPVKLPSSDVKTDPDVEASEDNSAIDELTETQHRASVWPWVAGLLVAGGIGYLVYFQQQLPVHQRTQVVDAIFDRITGWVEQVGGSELAGIDDDTEQSSSDTESSSMPSSQAVEASLQQDLSPSVTTEAIGPAGVPAPSSNPSSPIASVPVVSVLEQREQQLSQASALLKALPDDLDQGGEVADMYRTLLGQNPTDIEARQGLQSVRSIYENKARAALAGKDYAQVERVLEQAQAAFPLTSQDPRLEKIRTALRQQQQIDQWMEDAQRYAGDNALSQPQGGNAMEMYQRVLELQPQHLAAQQGVASVLKRLASGVERRMNRGEWQRASQNLQAALSVAPDNQKLQQLQATLERKRQIRRLAKAARRQRQQGDVFAPAGANTLQSLRKILALEPDHAEARQAVDSLEQGLASQVEQHIQAGAWDNARAQIARALAYFPNSTELQQLKAINEQAIWDAQQPRIDQLRVSHRIIDSLQGPQSTSLAVDGLIYVGFDFNNFGVETTVVNAHLFEGEPAIEVAQIPVILTRNQGEQYFRFEPPLQGFAQGRYRLEMILQGQSLVSTRFDIEAALPAVQSPLAPVSETP